MRTLGKRVSPNPTNRIPTATSTLLLSLAVVVSCMSLGGQRDTSGPRPDPEGDSHAHVPSNSTRESPGGHSGVLAESGKGDTAPDDQPGHSREERTPQEEVAGAPQYYYDDYYYNRPHRRTTRHHTTTRKKTTTKKAVPTTKKSVPTTKKPVLTTKKSVLTTKKGGSVATTKKPNSHNSANGKPSALPCHTLTHCLRSPHAHPADGPLRSPRARPEPTLNP